MIIFPAVSGAKNPQVISSNTAFFYARMPEIGWNDGLVGWDAIPAPPVETAQPAPVLRIDIKIGHFRVCKYISRRPVPWIP
jgi:hypothetical protein